MTEQTSYSLGVVVVSSSQKTVASCWLVVEVVERPAVDLAGPMEVVVGVVLDPRGFQVGDSALVAAEPMAVGGVVEVLGPMGLN